MPLFFYSVLNCFLLLASAITKDVDAWSSDHISLLQTGALSRSSSPSHIDVANVSKFAITSKFGRIGSESRSGDAILPDLSSDERSTLSKPVSQSLPTSLTIGLTILILVSRAQQEAQKNRKSFATESWTGLRAMIAFQVFTEHLNLHNWAGAGYFLLLSGAVLTVGKTCAIQTPKDYLRYISMRLFRIYPAVWVAEAFRLSNLDRGTNSPLAALIAMPFLHPARFFQYKALVLVEEKPLELWFVSTVICLYLLCPFLDMFLTYCGTRQCIKKCAGFAFLFYMMQLCVVAVAQNTPPCYGGPCNDYSLKRHYTRTLLGFYNICLYSHPIARLPQFLLGILVAHSLHALGSKSTEDGHEERERETQRVGMQPGPVQGTEDGHEDTDKDGGVFTVVLGLLTDAAMLSILGLAWYTRHIHLDKLPTDSFWPLVRNFQLSSPMFGLLLFGLGHPKASSLSKSFLTSPFMLELGKISFGVYLYGVFRKGSVKFDMWTDVGLYCKTLLVAFLSYHAVEEPTQRLVRWIWKSLDQCANLPDAVKS